MSKAHIQSASKESLTASDDFLSPMKKSIARGMAIRSDEMFDAASGAIGAIA